MLLLVGGLVAATSATSIRAATTLPAPYEGLVKVPSKNVGAVYLLPGANFRDYTRVMIDPAQVSFRKSWGKADSRSRGLSRRIDEKDAEDIAAAMRSGFEDIFAAAFRKKGYEVVSTSGPDVLRLSPAIVDLYINAPYSTTGGARRTYTVEAGEATLALEARDSTSGALLGVVIDRSKTRSTGQAALTTSLSNRTDFEDLFRRWADICVSGFEKLKTAPRSPQS